MAKKIALAVVAAALVSLAPSPRTTRTVGANLLGVQDACAQTGTCKRDRGSICFVDGVPFNNLQWIPGFEGF
jgi:hypothetical protein